MTIETTRQGIDLSPEEQKEIEERGFMVKKNYSIKYFLEMIVFSWAYLVIYWAAISILYAFITYLDMRYLETVLKYITLLVFLYPLLLYFKAYMQSGFTFYSHNSIINLWLVSDSIKNKNEYWLFAFHRELNYIRKSWKDWPAIYIGCILWWGIMVYIFLMIAIARFSFPYVIWTMCLGYISLEIVRKLYQTFHPLYAFWNLWSKIQSLTPEIEEQSKKIEKEFSSDMNFSLLSRSFDTLSTTFSKIVSLVIRLEQIEKRANKWNLFDSEKYINSLKWDIVKPLIALRGFLSTRLGELEQSKWEMQQVRVKVGWWEEALSLQSARTESLMVELRDNIEKLDGMIGKMG